MAATTPAPITSGRPVARSVPDAAAAAGLARKEYVWGDIYLGSADAIIAAGLATADRLPGSPGRGSRRVTYHDGQPAQRGKRLPRGAQRLRIFKRGADLFEVWVTATPEEQEARSGKGQQARRLKEAQAREARELASMPGSMQEYRDRTVSCLESMLDALKAVWLAEHDGHGYGFALDTINEFEVAAGALTSILQVGTVEFNGRRHRARIAKIKAETARADGTLQAALGAATVQALCGGRA